MKNPETYFPEVREKIQKYNSNNLKVFATSSFQTQSAVLLHILSEIDNSIPIYFLNTGYHFPETLYYKDQLTELFNLNVINLTSAIPKIRQKNEKENLLFTSDPDYCCYINKVQPMESVLKENDVWISGIRAGQSTTRQEMSIEDKALHNVIRYHPMLHWTSKMITDYIGKNKLPKHPLDIKGYLSIGCQPCTQKVEMSSPPETERSGRWFGMNKEECGIHTELVVKK
ncbi:MAG: phosphoadenylyl-sulfate reductase [Bacteroidota bacterium]